MPNWPISQAARSYLRQRSMQLSKRALDYANDGMPLTVTQIQYAVMPEERVKTMRALITSGVRTIERHRVIRLAFLRDKFPELRRGAVIHVELPEWIVVDRSTSYGMHTTKFEMDDHHYLVPDFSLNGPTHDLDPDQRKELIDWINRCIRQKRLHEIMNYATSHVLDKHAPTVAHLHQLWPMLCTLINSDQDTNRKFYKDREFYEMWRDRFRAPKRALTSYKPKLDTLDRFAKLIKACDTVLAAGIVLAPYEEDDKLIKAELQQWEPLPDDRTF
jgi:hypothetical protein